MEEEEDGEEEDEEDLVVTYPMKIVGAERNKTIIYGYCFNFEGQKGEGKNVELNDMTVKGSSGAGLFNYNGISFVCDSMAFTQCLGYGVYAKNTKGRLINLCDHTV